MWGGVRGPEVAPKPGLWNPCFCPFRFKFHCHFEDFLDSFQFFGFVYKTLMLDSPVSSAPPPQLKQLEVARAEKWLKMVKKWDKYKSSDRVSHRPQCLQTEEPDVSPMRKCITSHHKFHTENEQNFFLFVSAPRSWKFSFRFTMVADFQQTRQRESDVVWLLFRERVLIFLSRGGAVEWAAFLLLFLLSLSPSVCHSLSVFVRWWNGSTREFLCSSEAEPGHWCWTWREPRKKPSASMRYVHDDLCKWWSSLTDHICSW